MSRIELTDNTISSIIKMSEGNPGAATALSAIAKKANEIDPQSAFGSLAGILSLDTYEIYGSSIYVLFNDKCGRDVRSMLLLLRAVQLGFKSQSWLKELAEDQRGQHNISDEQWAEIDDKVCSQLVDFQRK